MYSIYSIYSIKPYSMCSGVRSPNTSSSRYDKKLRFAPGIRHEKYLRLMASVTGSRDCCVIYRPETDFLVSKMKNDVIINFFCKRGKRWKFQGHSMFLFLSSQPTIQQYSNQEMFYRVLFNPYNSRRHTANINAEANC